MNQITNSFTLQLSPGSECFTEKYYLNVIDRIEEEDYEENQYFVKMQSLFVNIVFHRCKCKHITKCARKQRLN